MLDSSSRSVPASCLCLRYPVISSTEFFMRQRQQNKLVSRLFSCPGFNTACCKMDFLHACDLGVTSDWLGSLLFFLQSEKIRGHKKRIRCAKLCQDIKAYYDRTGVTDRLPKLLPTMLREEDRGKIKSPKLRAKAGEARALVGAALELATKYLSPANPAGVAQKLCSPCMPVSALQLGTRTSSEFLLRNFCYSGAASRLTSKRTKSLLYGQT